MQRVLLLVIVMIVSVLLVGCGVDENNHTNSFSVDEQLGENFSEEKDKTIELVATEKTLPANFQEIAFEREETPLFQYLVKKVDNQSEYKEVWELYELEDEKPSIDFDRKDIYFIGAEESSDCPNKIKEIKINDEDEGPTVSLEQVMIGEGCNDDDTPRTYVIEMTKDAAKDILEMTILYNEQGEEDQPIKTNITIEN